MLLCARLLATRLKLLHILLYHKWHFLALLCTKIENQQALIKDYFLENNIKEEDL
jgi:hypothetical protein